MLSILIWKGDSAEGAQAAEVRAEDFSGKDPHSLKVQSFIPKVIPKPGNGPWDSLFLRKYAAVIAVYTYLLWSRGLFPIRSKGLGGCLVRLGFGVDGAAEPYAMAKLSFVLPGREGVETTRPF
ncbi:hypothetical protein LJK88_33020 [Paenibacillus sp. P26]|nr:hypothetical protein LJK88_33020 [Paenibacillus sp. P26]